MGFWGTYVMLRSDEPPARLLPSAEALHEATRDDGPWADGWRGWVVRDPFGSLPGDLTGQLHAATHTPVLVQGPLPPWGTAFTERDLRRVDPRPRGGGVLTGPQRPADVPPRRHERPPQRRGRVLGDGGVGRPPPPPADDDIPPVVGGRRRAPRRFPVHGHRCLPTC